MGIGGFALPLIAPFVGVLIMLATPRWNCHQVRVTGLIVGIGVVALMALMVVAASGATSSAAVRGAMAILAVVVLVGPIAALYAATRPR